MKPFNRFLIAAFVSAAMVLPNIAQAMEIRQFDKMTNDDQAEYVSELISGAEKVLTDEGLAEQAAKIESLFTTNAPDSNTSIGMSDFMLDLAQARLADAQRALKDPNAHRLEVEDAMLVMLKRNNIPLSQDFIRDFRATNKHFQPKSSPVVPSAPPQQ